MRKPAQGQIVLAEVLDPQRRNRKCHPVVIVTPTDEIKDDEPFVAVVITSTLPAKVPEDHVQLLYHNEGHAKTGLRRRCAAVCSWLVEIRCEDIIQYKGVAPAKQLAKILALVEKLC